MTSSRARAILFWKHFPLTLLLGHKVILTRFQPAYEFVNYKSISIWRGKLQIRLYKAHYVIGKENCWYTLSWYCRRAGYRRSLASWCSKRL